jgi:hypothetical protein
VGRTSSPVATLAAGAGPLVAIDKAQTWTWYRIVFPVKPHNAKNSSAGQQP